MVCIYMTVGNRNLVTRIAYMIEHDETEKVFIFHAGYRFQFNLQPEVKQTDKFNLYMTYKRSSMYLQLAIF